MTTLNLRVGDYVVVTRWYGQQYVDSVELIIESLEITYFTTTPRLYLLFLGRVRWVEAQEVTRNATTKEAIRYHEKKANFLAQTRHENIENIHEAICYHRDQIRILQAFSGQAGKKTRR